jgi:hypothetical protein
VSEAGLCKEQGMKWKNTNKRFKKSDQEFVSCTQNLFAEQKYIMARNTQTNEAQVHNLVGTCRICSGLGSIDLLAVSNLLPNALFEKQKFAAITIRMYACFHVFFLGSREVKRLSTNKFVQFYYT